MGLIVPPPHLPQPFWEHLHHLQPIKPPRQLDRPTRGLLYEVVLAFGTKGFPQMVPCGQWLSGSRWREVIPRIHRRTGRHVKAWVNMQTTMARRMEYGQCGSKVEVTLEG